MGGARRKLISFLLFISGFTVITLTVKQTHSSNNTNADHLLPSPLDVKCKHVSLDELNQWFHSKQQWNEIPKIIHQSWKNRTLSERQARWSETWCDQYSGWLYHLWTDEENDHFVQTKFAWFYPTYKNLTPPILKADSVRYLYMHYYGGLYLDLDYESIRRVDHLFNNKDVIFSLINYHFVSKNSIPNSWMASRPNHSLWLCIIHRIILLWSHVSDKVRNEFWNGKAEFFTGPQALFEGLTFYINLKQQTNQSLYQLLGNKDNLTPDAIFQVGDITFLGPKFMNAYDWMTRVGSDVCSAENSTFSEEKCKAKVKPLYGITYWSHTYGHANKTNFFKQ